VRLVLVPGGEGSLTERAQQPAAIAVRAGEGKRCGQQPHRVLVADPSDRVGRREPSELDGRTCLASQLRRREKVPGGDRRTDGAGSVPTSEQGADLALAMEACRSRYSRDILDTE
jgi:hypothetical protein